MFFKWHAASSEGFRPIASKSYTCRWFRGGGQKPFIAGLKCLHVERNHNGTEQKRRYTNMIPEVAMQRRSQVADAARDTASVHGWSISMQGRSPIGLRLPWTVTTRWRVSGASVTTAVQNDHERSASRVAYILILYCIVPQLSHTHADYWCKLRPCCVS